MSLSPTAPAKQKYISWVEGIFKLSASVLADT